MVIHYRHKHNGIQNYMIISLDIEKTLTKSNTIHEKRFGEIKDIYLNLKRVAYRKSIASINLNEEKLKAIPLNSVKRQSCPLHNHSL